MTIDDAVAEAIRITREWHEAAVPSAKRRPRFVIVADGASRYARTPFKRRGQWCVHLAGTARLIDPRREGDDIVFTPKWD